MTELSKRVAQTPEHVTPRWTAERERRVGEALQRRTR